MITGLYKKILFHATAVLVLGSTLFGQYDDGRFSEYEIRVIRPRFFQKSGKFELFGAGSMITNNTFVYTLLATGGAQFHVNEYFAAQASASFGYSLSRTEKEVLTDKFNIQTEVFRVQYELDLNVNYTPIYGKIQLNNRELMYFDTYFSGGFGMTGVDWQYSDFCPKQTNSDVAQDIPANQTVSYPSFLFGIGQRFFTSKNSALRWDFKGRIINYDTADSSCVAGGEASSDTKTLLSIQIGKSTYF